MKYIVRITETYTYEREMECGDESELQDILHEQIPPLVDMDRTEIERIRRDGLDFRSDFEW